MRVIEHAETEFIVVKCPSCHMIFDWENLIVELGTFSVTYTCPYCNYSQKKRYYLSFPSFPEWEDEETEAITEANFDRILEEEREDVDSN